MPSQIGRPPFATTNQPQDLLEQCRTRWQHGRWEDLANLTQDEISNADSREKVAALVAAGHAHCGQISQAREIAQLALSWGCERQILARVFLAAAYNDLACATFCLQENEDETQDHFETSMRLVEPRAEIELLSRTRRIRELMRRGLLPEVAELLESELQIARQTPHLHSDRLTIIESDISLLKHELQISLSRRQIYSRVSSVADDLEGQSMSQLGQDLWVLERLDYKRNGFFIEFGATDGVTLSNSWLLEKKFNWEGICAEPNPKFFGKLKNNRSCSVSKACIGPRTGEQVEFILADVYGSILDYANEDTHHKKRAAYRSEGKTVILETISLDDFLIQNNAPRNIDYLSIDTEGSEFDILSTFPFDKWNVNLFTIEHNFTPKRQQIRELMEANGYTCTAAQFDDWYEKL